MKKSLTLFLAAAIISLSFIACGGSKKDDPARPGGPSQPRSAEASGPQGNGAEEKDMGTSGEPGHPAVELRSKYQNVTQGESEKMVKDLGFYSQHAHLNPYAKIFHLYEAKNLDSDNVVVDHVTGLMWHPSGSDRDITYAEIEDWLADLNAHAYAGFSDWRLPTLEEAASLIEGSEKNGYLHIDPLFSEKQHVIWTGDFLSHPDLKALDNQGNEIGPYPPAQWVVGFFGPGINPNNRNSKYSLRPVRSL